MTPRLLVKIAAGGQATVWVARAEDDTLVAVKRPHPHLFDDARFLSTLEREATIASHLRHPNVVATRALVRHEGTADIVMEYVDGVTLADLVEAWRESPSTKTTPVAVRIAVDMCSGLEAVHDASSEHGEPLHLVHRDVSPQNVLVAADGTAKLADFGLVRSIATGERSTTDGILKGKAGYLAPEYVRGAPVDRRADVFAVGVVLWEAITKRRLFRGENDADTLQRILKCEVPSLAVDVGEGGDALDAIVKRALTRGPADRTATAGELGAELREWLERFAPGTSQTDVAGSFGANVNAKIESRRKAIADSVSPAPSRPAKTDAKRGPFSPALLAAVVVASGLALGYAIHSFRSPAPTTPEPVAVVPTTTTPPEAVSATNAAATPPPEIELVDVPASSAPTKHGSVVKSKSSANPAVSSTASPPQPRKNPYLP